MRRSYCVKYYSPWIVWSGEQEGLAWFGEAKHEGLVCGGGPSCEYNVVGIKSHLVPSYLRHEVHQCLLEGR